jgi:hypothetical protein
MIMTIEQTQRVYVNDAPRVTPPLVASLINDRNMLKYKLLIESVSSFGALFKTLVLGGLYGFSYLKLISLSS